uniref:Uncharacterized protein n=1 Tax=Anopheles coluzzii TaxID=1518534 RepID=A0A8W7PU05_ANOCL
MWGSCSRSMQTNALPAVMLSATTFASSSRLPMKMTYAWTRGDWRASAAFSLRGVMPYRARLASLSTITIASSQSSLASSSTASSVAASVWSPLQQNWACACIILIVSSRRFASFGGLFSLTNGTATASPLCPTIVPLWRSSRPAYCKLSIGKSGSRAEADWMPYANETSLVSTSGWSSGPARAFASVSTSTYGSSAMSRAWKRDRSGGSSGEPRYRGTGRPRAITRNFSDTRTSPHWSSWSRLKRCRKKGKQIEHNEH